ncbi:MAG: hypothetical protein ACLUDU_19235 [Butyricimonas faecihominis]
MRQKNLEMPFTVGDLKPGGRLYADFMTPEFLNGTAIQSLFCGG